MTTEDFISAITVVVFQSAAESTLQIVESPPGRSPSKDLTELSAWYNTLSAQDKGMVARTITQAARIATFGFLCVLDGVRTVEDQIGPKGDFELYFVKDGQRTLLNPTDRDFLHDLFNDSTLK